MSKKCSTFAPELSIGVLAHLIPFESAILHEQSIGQA